MAVSIATDHLLVVLFLGLLAWAALSDGLSFRIPNTATLGIALLYPAHALASPAAVDWLGALATCAVVFIVGFGIFVKGAFGGGDVKLLSASALWAGPHQILTLLIVMGMTGGLLAAVVWARQYVRRFRVAGISGLAMPDAPGAMAEQVPYGIAIAVGAACVGVRLMLG